MKWGGGPQASAMEIKIETEICLIVGIIISFRVSFLFPFSTFSLFLVEVGGIGIAFLLYNIYPMKGGEKDG
jgi:hypothetical protein